MGKFFDSCTLLFIALWAVVPSDGFLAVSRLRMRPLAVIPDAQSIDESVDMAKSVLCSAAETKAKDSDTVVENLLALEKLMRKRNSLDNGVTGAEVLDKLNGAWRLVFTTGTVDTQKKVGRVNYFPLKAVQSFDTASMTVTNGIYVGDFAVLKFFGPFEFNTKSRKLVFDFDEIAVVGARFPLPKGGAAKIGSSTGLGSENNVDLVEKGKKPFFNWISADEKIATARGGGGGLALWMRDAGMEAINAKEKAKSRSKAPTVSELDLVNQNISISKNILRSAAETKAKDSDTVVENLLALEKLMRKRNSLDNGVTGAEVLDKLNGAWRLVFTTGTVDTQKKVGRVNYFPLKAVQSFDTASMTVTNGIYVGDFAVLKFFGPFEFNTKSKKLVFDFDEIAVVGARFPLPKGGAAKIGSSTGLGSENNVDLVEKGKKPFFNWISADDEIATARGGGGGLALWMRDAGMEAINAKEKVIL